MHDNGSQSAPGKSIPILSTRKYLIMTITMDLEQKSKMLPMPTSVEGQRVRQWRNESVRDGAELGEGAVSPRADSTPHATVITKVGLSSLTEVASIAVP